MAFIEPMHCNKPNITYLLTPGKQKFAHRTLTFCCLVTHYGVLEPGRFLPEASFGLRVLLSPASVGQCVCVYQSWACPHDNSSPVQARITKFGPKVQNTLVKFPIFGNDQCCSKSKFLGRPTDHQQWIAGWSVLPLGGPDMLRSEMKMKQQYRDVLFIFNQ